MYYINIDSNDCTKKSISDYIFEKKLIGTKTIGIYDCEIYNKNTLICNENKNNKIKIISTHSGPSIGKGVFKLPLEEIEININFESNQINDVIHNINEILKKNNYNNYPEQCGLIFSHYNNRVIIKNNSMHYKTQIEFIQSENVQLNEYLGFKKSKYLLDFNSIIISDEVYKNHMDYIFININDYKNILSKNKYYFAKLYYNKYNDTYKLERPYYNIFDTDTDIENLNISFYSKNGMKLNLLSHFSMVIFIKYNKTKNNMVFNYD